MPWQALSIQGVWGSQISRQSVHEGGKLVSFTHLLRNSEQIKYTNTAYKRLATGWKV